MVPVQRCIYIVDNTYLCVVVYSIGNAYAKFLFWKYFQHLAEKPRIIWGKTSISLFKRAVFNWNFWKTLSKRKLIDFVLKAKRGTHYEILTACNQFVRSLSRLLPFIARYSGLRWLMSALFVSCVIYEVLPSAATSLYYYTEPHYGISVNNLT